MGGDQFIFEDLDVYQRSLDFVDMVYAFTEGFPKHETYGLASQFRRASVSVSLNLAEGAGRQHKRERKQFFMTSRSSVFECVALVEISLRRGYIEASQSNAMRQKCQKLSRMIMGLAKANSPD